MASALFEIYDSNFLLSTTKTKPTNPTVSFICLFTAFPSALRVHSYISKIKLLAMNLNQSMIPLNSHQFDTTSATAQVAGAIQNSAIQVDSNYTNIESSPRLLNTGTKWRL